MALADFEVFIREKLRSFDDSLDLTPGSPVDTQVIQPLLKRLGTDPFTTDAATFIIDRLSQEFPDLAATDGDAVSDLLMKPALVLFDPLIREIQRVKNMLSFKDPSVLTTEEAEALGANLFATRNTGSYARGTGRIYFAQPIPQTITPANFFTSKSGLHFFPTTAQSIKAEEMLLNKEGDLYYFDVQATAEAVGDEYNLEPNELVTIANVAAAVRVTNKLRFRFGEPEQDAIEFVGTIQQELSERSLVTLRGIASQVGNAFPEATRLSVVGFNDPEMKRDVLSGGSLGEILASGFDAQVVADGENKSRTRRFTASSADFFTDIGPAGSSSGYIVTLFDMFGPTASPRVRDLEVTRVVNATTLEVAEQVLYPGASSKAWTLRKRSLLLSQIPGGILFPDGPNGTVSIAPDELHIGGMTDIHVRGSDLDTATLTLDIASDDSPVLQGTGLSIVASGLTPAAYELELGPDLVLGTDYQEDDDTYAALARAKEFQYTLQILEGVAAGSYRVLDVVQVAAAAPVLWVDPVPPAVAGTFRWRLLDELDIDLVEPKETRVAGSDGSTTQNLDIFTTLSGIDFDELGVSVDDILRIKKGPNAGDYVVKELVAPFFQQVRVDRPFIVSSAGAAFEIFRSNTGGGVLRPLVRVTSIDILDTSGQPIGTKIPYAKPVDVLSSQFANAGAGVKTSAVDGVLGLVSQATLANYSFGTGGDLKITWDSGPTITVALSGTLASIAVTAAINVASQLAVGLDLAVDLSYNGYQFVGLIPLGPNTRVDAASTASVVQELFGSDTREYSSRDVRSESITAAGWPAVDADLDALWVVDGVQSGFYSDLVAVEESNAVYKLTVSQDFAPEVARSMKVGARSIGTARVYFLEPTSAEIDQSTVFTYTTADGIDVRFKPDPTLGHQRIPALPNGSKPKDGVTTNLGSTLTSTSTDFVRNGIREGDELVIDYVPVDGSATLSDPVAGLALKDIVLSLNDQPDKKITFVNDVGVAGAVSRKGVVEQINSAVGLEICELYESAPGVYNLRFNPEMALLVRQQNGSPTEANTLLGFSNTSDTSNASAHAGTYTINGVTTNALTLELLLPFAGSVSEQQFKVQRPGAQRIATSTMEAQTAETGLYFWDVELVSEGTGDLWNIPASSTLKMEGYRSDGYYLTTTDDTTSFSPAENVSLRISRSILPSGVDDSPENAIQVSGQSLSISYERSQLVDNLQGFITSDVERVVNENPLARFLTPSFVRFDATYTGGSKASEVLPDIEQLVKDTLPDGALSSSDIQNKIRARGATGVTNPIELIAVIHNFDRTVTVTRSEDELTTGRLAAFIPDKINLTRRTS